MATIQEAFIEAQKLLADPKIHGVSIKDNRIVVYAEEGAYVPKTILGYEVEVVKTEKFGAL